MSEHLGHNQLEDINEIHVRNPNYKGKNYDPNYQTKKAEATTAIFNSQREPVQGSLHQACNQQQH